MKISFLVVLLALIAVSDLFAVTKCIKKLGALDIGSGTTKLKVAKVDVCKKRIKEVLLIREKPVGYKESLENSKNNEIDLETIEIGEKALLELVAAARDIGAEKVLAVATSAFRVASNGPAVLKKLSEKFHFDGRVISQEEEARLGFLAAASLSQQAPDEVIVWDIGGGSMQISSMGKEGLDIFKGKMASVSFKNQLIQKLLKKNLSEMKSPNPIGSKNILEAVNLARESAKLVGRKFAFDQRRVLGIGGVHYYSVKGQLKPKEDFYNQNSLANYIAKVAEKTDAELGGKYASTNVSNLILVLGFMQELGIKRVYPYKINLSDGVLLSQ